MKKITIGLLGCSCGTDNMGCNALMYSLMQLTEKVCKQENIYADYNIFDVIQDGESIDDLCNTLDISRSRVYHRKFPFWDYSNISGCLRTLRHYFENKEIKQIIKKCDIVIDLTHGDSFSDIYGLRRFFSWTRVKKAVEDMGKPLVLGPQTYGPFDDESVKKYAKKVIENAYCVISRDQISADYLHSFCKKEVLVTTDLAFRLPYNKEKSNKTNNKIKVGINPSGLLAKKKNDLSGFSKPMSVEYDKYIREIIQWLLQEGRYEIHMISHVGNEAIECMDGIEGVQYHKAFNTPIEAKNVISQMDVFLGARMHATIAAFSSGVATIPTAYSRKFAGLYQGIGYKYVIDLCSMSTDESIGLTKQYILDYKNLENEVQKSFAQIEEKYDVLENRVKDLIISFSHV